MALGWNDIIADGDQWADHAYLNLFEQAMWERLNAARISQPWTPWSAGDHINAAVAGTHVGHPMWMQTIAANLCTQFLHPDYLDPNTWPDPYPVHRRWTLAQVFAAIGKPDGLTRKYERRIATLIAAAYLDGDAPADGDYARCVADFRVYMRAAGAWVISTHSHGDTVTTQVTAVGGSAGTFVQFGDYIGPWIFNETRDMLNLCLYTEGGANWAVNATGGTAYNYHGSTNDGPVIDFLPQPTTFEDAVAQATANWTARPILNMVPQAGAINWTLGTDGTGYGSPGAWSAQAISWRNYPIYFQDFADLSAAVPRTVQLWIFATKAGLLSGGTTNTFDDFGVGLEENRWIVWASGSVAQGGTTFYDGNWIGDNATMPDNWQRNAQVGFSIDWITSVVQWSFTQAAP